MAQSKVELDSTLDMSRAFLPLALEGLSPLRALDEDDRRTLNQIRACSYLHLFDAFESSLAATARARARHDVDVRDVLAPLLRLDAFDHHELFRSFEDDLIASLPVSPRLVAPPVDFASALAHVSPLTLLVLALHLKLVTQQHYLACVRGDETLEPHFVRLLKDHWTVECGQSRTSGSVLAIQQALSRATPGRVTPALRDYRLVVFACDDVLVRQARLDVHSLDAARAKEKGPLSDTEQALVLAAEIASLRKTFLTVGIVNAAFVYAMRSLGPAAPSMLAGIVSALSSRA